MMRIITGKARGIKLATLEGDATRPTSERAKQAIFSMIQFQIEGRRVLDLFAGSGQLGLEAVSQGAAHAVLVDQSKEAIKIITKNAQNTKLAENCTIICAEFAEFARQSRGREGFDIVFIDPPYAMKAVPAAVEALMQARLIKPHTMLICESAEPQPLGTETAIGLQFDVIKEAKYGKAYVTIYTPKA